MKLELTTKQFRRLLDMVYIGNWILNSTRGEDRFQDYDKVESLLFSKARAEGMGALAEVWNGEVIPSRAFAGGFSARGSSCRRSSRKRRRRGYRCPAGRGWPG